MPAGERVKDRPPPSAVNVSVVAPVVVVPVVFVQATMLFAETDSGLPRCSVNTFSDGLH